MIGIGLDAVDIDRFRRVIGRRPALIERLFTVGERELCARSDPVPGLAARFAAKEAAMKALGVGLGAVDFVELEVVRSPSGAPVMATHGRASTLVAARGATALLCSLTHTGALAGAVVVAV